MTGEERAAKTAAWLEHLRAWRESGLTLAAYARQQQLKVWEAYGWRQILQRQGLWMGAHRAQGEGPASNASASAPRAVRFARVRVKGERPAVAARSAPMIVRVSFANGRIAQLEVAGADRLEEVFSVLERVR